MEVTSNKGRAYLTALHSAYLSIGRLTKDKTADAGKYSYDYTSLNAVIALNPVLWQHGLKFDEQVTLTGVLTTLTHVESLEYSQSFFPFDTPAHGKDGIIDGLNFQDNGKTVTYGRRYNRLVLLGLPQDDADTEKPVERRPAKGSKETSSNNVAW